MSSLKYRNPETGEWGKVKGGAGVGSFNGRAGAVKPAFGDYTAEMVGAAEKTHASQHAAGGSDPITPAAIGAFSSGGGTITGNLIIRQRGNPFVLLGNLDSGVQMYLQEHEGKLYLGAGSVKSLVVDGEGNAFANGGKNTILHTGNKPSGSYTGNNSVRELIIGGVGYALMISSFRGIGIVSGHGAVFVDSSGAAKYFSYTQIKFGASKDNGKLEIIADEANRLFNYGGDGSTIGATTYTYQVL